MFIKILGNTKIHHAKIIEEVCDILNIKLIFLEPYCPDLNPIEDVWRTINEYYIIQIIIH